MKIQSVSNLLYTVNNSDIQKKRNFQNSYTDNSMVSNYQPAGYELLRNLLVRPNINFTGNFDDEKSKSEATKALLQEINRLKAEKEALMIVNEEEKVKQAKAELELCDFFEKNRYKLYTDAENAREHEYDAVRGKQDWWDRMFSRDAVRAGNKVFEDSEYIRCRDKYLIYKDRKELNQNIIENAEKSREEKALRIRTLDDLIAAKTKYADYTAVTNLIEEYMNGEYGINTKIAGYDDVKQEINEFIGKLNHDKGHIPSCVLLYGAIGTGKSTFLKCIEDSAKGNVETVRFYYNPNGDIDFITAFDNYLEEAKTRYKNEGKRTVLLMDDAEEYFAKTLDSALEHKDNYTPDELARLQVINERGTNENVAQFKHIFDVLSQEPNGNDRHRSATTIFITTNYPHLINDDLMYREGKVHAFHVGPAENRDLADVIKYYFNQSNDTLSFIKLLGSQTEEIQRESLNHIDELTPRGRATLMYLFKNSVADQILNIDCESPDFMKMAKIFNPNIRHGAYTNDQIAHISRRALRKYAENPNEDYLKYFMDEMIHSKRAISPDMLKHFNQIEKSVNLIAHRPDGNDADSYEELLHILISGKNISPDEQAMIDNFVEVKRPRLEALEDKYNRGLLDNEDEADEYMQLQQIFELIDSEG